MTRHSDSSRRSFLKASALLAAPLATAAAPAMARAADDGRLARLENEAAIRSLQQDWLRRINRGGNIATAKLSLGPGRVTIDPSVRGIVADHTGVAETIALAADGSRAAGRFACIVETVTELAQDCTFAQMAHAQGGGMLRTSARRMMLVDYVKSAEGWAITNVTFADG